MAARRINTVPTKDVLFGNAIFQYNFSFFANVLEMKPYISQCLKTRCPDGTCADTCVNVRYNCPGNGCVNLGKGNFVCACKQGTGGLRCQNSPCFPPIVDPATFIEQQIDSSTWCQLYAPLVQLPPVSLLQSIHIYSKDVLTIVMLL